MENILEKITNRIRQDRAREFETFSIENFQPRRDDRPLDVVSLMEDDSFVIAEVKRASPSRGIIRRNFNPMALARGYVRGGASAISVITERHFFQGSPKYLYRIAGEVKLPLLRKDFIIHPCQVYESFNLGADFILLIVACLSDDLLIALYTEARSLGMEAIFEVHDAVELERALKAYPRIIGINNRDLRTFHVDIRTSFRLKRLIPAGIQVICESGIYSPAQVKELRANDFSGLLVGESLLKQKDVSTALKELING